MRIATVLILKCADHRSHGWRVPEAFHWSSYRFGRERSRNSNQFRSEWVTLIKVRIFTRRLSWKFAAKGQEMCIIHECRCRTGQSDENYPILDYFSVKP